MIATSLLASVPVPSMDAYIAGKWGQPGLARVLQLELRDEPDIHVCTLAPGSVDTPISRHAANSAGRVGRPPPPVVSAEKMARAVLRMADRPVKRRAVGPANGIVVFGYRLLPALYDHLVGPLAPIAVFARDTLLPTKGNVFVPQTAGPARRPPDNAVPDGTPPAGPPTDPGAKTRLDRRVDRRGETKSWRGRWLLPTRLGSSPLGRRCPVRCAATAREAPWPRLQTGLTSPSYGWRALWRVRPWSSTPRPQPPPTWPPRGARPWLRPPPGHPVPWAARAPGGAA